MTRFERKATAAAAASPTCAVPTDRPGAADRVGQPPPGMLTSHEVPNRSTHIPNLSPTAGWPARPSRSLRPTAPASSPAVLGVVPAEADREVVPGPQRLARQQVGGHQRGARRCFQLAVHDLVANAVVVGAEVFEVVDREIAAEHVLVERQGGRGITPRSSGRGSVEWSRTDDRGLIPIEGAGGSEAAGLDGTSRSVRRPGTRALHEPPDHAAAR